MPDWADPRGTAEAWIAAEPRMPSATRAANAHPFFDFTTRTPVLFEPKPGAQFERRLSWLCMI
jgi:hypothetical protein